MACKENADFIQKNHPLVSVIIPVYNTAPYLEEAVRSVMNQTLSDIEIIVVDDCSTDGSVDIIRALADEDERISYHCLPTNGGQSIARNKALQTASGKYIYFMDSDDVLENSALEECALQCQERDLQVLFFDGEIFCEEEATFPSWDYRRTEDYDENSAYEGPALFENMLANYTHRAVPWLLFISHEHLNQLRLSFYPGIIHEDELFTTLLYLQTRRAGCLKKSLVRHRVRGNSTMTKRYSLRNVDCYLTVIKELQKFASAKDEQIKNIVNHYCRYTLNPVFQTAKSLPFGQKWKAFVHCAQAKCLHFITLRTFASFWWR